MRFFLTGATGFLGREVLVRLLAAGHSVLVTSRRKPGETDGALSARLTRMVEDTAPGTPIERLVAAAADVTEPDLALSPVGRTFLAVPEPIQIVHGAAEVRFDLPYERMRRQNVEGTEHVVALAKRLYAEGRLVRLDHVSTAFVAGAREGLALESEVDVGQSPRNDYERTKLETEVMLERERKGGLPMVVHRPSIIVGDSRTGRASSFKVLYWPLKLYSRGRFRTIFGRPACTIDVVPVDFVADAMVHLFGRPEIVGGIFNLAAGEARQSTIGALAQLTERVYDGKKVRYLDPDLYFRWLRPILLPILKLFRPDVAERGGVFLPYLKSNPTFDVRRAAAILEPAGISPPAVESYFEVILRFAKETDFGAKPPKALTPGRPTSS